MSGKFYLLQLGCPKNEVDGEHLMGALRRAGYVRGSNPSESDVLIVNTCGFIESAKQESINRILELATYKNGNGKRLLVAGCLAQRYPKQLLKDIPEIDALVGVDRIEDVVEAAQGGVSGNCFVKRPQKEYDEFDAPRMRADVPWAYIKISDGCDNACAFCAIPQFRGKNRSRSIDEILREASEMADSGVRELVVVAQDTTSYGVDRYGKQRLPELMLRLGEIDGICWVRLMYAFPRFVSDELIDVIGDGPNIVRYLDMPTQHINDDMLKAMNRGLDGKGTRALLNRLRDSHENIALRTSVVVGHPTETDHAFSELADFIADFEFDRLGVFVYSREEGTPAARMEPQVNVATAELRRRILHDIQAEILAQRQDEQIGKTLDVLTLTIEDGERWGRSEADAPDVDCSVRIDAPVDVGQILRAKCTSVYGVDLVVVPEEPD